MLKKLDNSEVGAIQKALMEFEDKPKSPGLNYEHLHSGGGDFCSIRASRDIRIILCPLEGETGANWLVVYVDHHDAAYDWVRKRKLAYIDQTQTYNILRVPGEEMAESVSQAHTAHKAIAALNEKELKALGIGDALLPYVQRLKDMSELKALGEYLPELTMEALQFLLSGEPYQEVRELVEAGKLDQAREPEQVLQSPNNQRQISRLKRTDELERYYSGDFEDWMVYLHHTQRILATGDFKGSVKLTGGAGTGKTVVALHRAKYLQEHRRSPLPILFTTFNRNLAGNLERQFQLLGIDTSKVILTNIHRWAAHQAKQLGLLDNANTIIEFDEHIQPIDIWKSLIEKHKSSCSAEFLQEEYEEVFLYYPIRNESEYMEISRKGRGKSLTSIQRQELYTLTHAYTEELRRIGAVHLSQIVHDLADYYEQHSSDRPFSHVIVDEVQDFGMAELKLIRQLTAIGENDLFLCGDPMQKIYPKRFSFTHAGISVRGRRSQHLKINYRTTEEIRQWAFRVVSQESFADFDTTQWQLKGYYSLFRGEEPEYKLFKDVKAEYTHIVEQVMFFYEQEIPPEEICVCAFRNAELKEITKTLHQEGIPYFDLRNSKGERTGIRISSFHGVKGMEFRVMILMGISKDKLPHRFRGFNLLSPERQAEAVRTQKSLIYVAMSRARDFLVLTGVGEKTDFWE